MEQPKPKPEEGSDPRLHSEGLHYALSHVSLEGKAGMVDISHKRDQIRVARAEGYIRLRDETLRMIREDGMKKGAVLTVAEIAGVQAAKQTPSLIPL